MTQDEMHRRRANTHPVSPEWTASISTGIRSAGYPAYLLMTLISTALLIFAAPVHAAKKDKDKDEDSEKVRKERLAEEKKVKAQFAYSFNDIADSIVIITCRSDRGRSSGSGFVATVDGKPYLFTNQHVIMGADTIRFKTASGKELKPRGVELSLNRDIARLPLAKGNGLPISENMSEDGPIGVFGNSDGGGVATELYGKITDIDTDVIEVSADFVAGNSGSPVMNLDREVVGIASYVQFRYDDEDGSESRRFCYRLTGDRWAPVNWKKYNDQFGQQYREAEELVDSVFELAVNWYDNPFTRMNADDHPDSDLREWSTSHNHVINRIDRMLEKGRATQHQLDNTNERISKDLFDSAAALAEVCRDHADRMRFLCDQQRGMSGFLRMEFESMAERLEHAAVEVDKFGNKLAEYNFFSFK